MEHLDVVSYRNSTSNHNCLLLKWYTSSVVSYRNSTSNHNVMLYNCARILVVSYRNSTSNHNILVEKSIYLRLYLIEILHQTTTQTGTLIATAELYLIEILHQTTTYPERIEQKYSCILSKFYIKPQPCRYSRMDGKRCILSKFYIKPQRLLEWPRIFLVVSYRNSTSNHNL